MASRWTRQPPARKPNVSCSATPTTTTPTSSHRPVSNTPGTRSASPGNGSDPTPCEAPARTGEEEDEIGRVNLDLSGAAVREKTLNLLLPSGGPFRKGTSAMSMPPGCGSPTVASKPPATTHPPCCASPWYGSSAGNSGGPGSCLLEVAAVPYFSYGARSPA